MPMPYSLTYSASSQSEKWVGFEARMPGSRMRSDTLRALFLRMANTRGASPDLLSDDGLISLWLIGTHVWHVAAFILAHYTQRYRRQLRTEAARCRQNSSRCFQGYTTKHAGTAEAQAPSRAFGDAMDCDGLGKQFILKPL